jgi:hypothetical protein
MQKPALYSALLAAFVLILPVEASAKTNGHRPVVVELFTSQSCSACLAADALVADLAERKDVLALTFPVDYWDYLGWQDTFARPEFSARQRAYQKALGLRDVYTPQLVVDGAAQMGKAAPETAPEMIRDAAKAHGPAPQMSVRGRKLIIAPGRFPAGGADVWLVRYEGQPQETAVKDGENRGVTVVYRNVAKSLTRLGAWSGKMRSYALPAAPADDPGLKSAVLLQSRASGRILGVLKR